MSTKPQLRRYDVDNMPIDKFIALSLCESIRLGLSRLSDVQRCERCVQAAEDGIPYMIHQSSGLRGCENVNRKFREMMTDS